MIRLHRIRIESSRRKTRTWATSTATTREDRDKGLFVSFDYTTDALHEIDAFFRKSGKIIVALAVREILDEQLAKKLA